ncbi:MAG: leucine-rich repeat protein, partial [Clostridia bacterium]|nr:leucine-rich repeat protein [Clostridia bacterium]
MKRSFRSFIILFVLITALFTALLVGCNRQEPEDEYNYISSQNNSEASVNEVCDTPYKVEHYLENLDGTYTLKDTEDLLGVKDKKIVVTTKSYDGFNAPEPQTEKILSDGSLEVKYFYSRASYTATFVTNGGDAVATKTFKYEEKIEQSVSRSGYSFGGWYNEAALLNEALTMPASDTSFYAYWTEENRACDFNFSLDGDGATITKYVANDNTVCIPAYIGGKEVAEIGEFAFHACSELKSVKMPSGLTKISNHAFFGCSQLASVDIPQNVTFVGAFAFRDCASLTRVNMGDKVTSIGTSAFENCRALTTVRLSSALTSVSDATFSNCFALESIIMPDTVTSVGNSAFSMCKIMSSIRISKNLRTIGEYAFFGCEGITKMDMPDTVADIGISAFLGFELNYNFTEHNNGLYIGNAQNPYVILYDVANIDATSFSIPAGTKAIYYSAFGKCTKMTSIAFEEGSSITNIGYRAFSACEALTAFEIPETVTNIGYRAFSGCMALREIEIPANVTSIGDSAFEGCINLANLRFASGSKLKTIGCSAFMVCRSLSGVTIPESVTSIGNFAFNDCINLTGITFLRTQGWQVSKSPEIAESVSVDVANPNDVVEYMTYTY